MASRNRQRSNIIFILSDDQGAWTLGCSGNREIQTPNLDGLAASGTLLAQCFTASPVCSPARASLLTGRLPSAHGVHDFLRPLGPEKYQTTDYLDGFTTTVDVLASAGWRCGLSGKWHLGNAGDPGHGFEHAYIHAGGQGPYYKAPMWRSGHLVHDDEYLTTLITDDAIEFLGGSLQDDRPFYLSVNYTAPHSPWLDQHPREFTSLYEDCEFDSSPQETPHPWWSAPSMAIAQAMDDPHPSLVGYYAAVTAMDSEIGRILSWLKEHDLESSTLVVFMSDNGFSCGHHGIWGKGNSTWPLNVFEESIAVPGIVSQPGTVESGNVCHALISGCDLHPTLLDAVGVPVPEDPLMAGTSFWPAMTQPSSPSHEREHIVVYDEYGDTRAVRTEEWKYVDRGVQELGELYSLANDPHERENLITDGDYRSTRSELRTLLHDFFAAHADRDMDPRGAGVAGAGQALPYHAKKLESSAFYKRDKQNPSY